MASLFSDALQVINKLKLNESLCYIPVTKQQQLQITFRDNTESCANDNISEEARKYNQHLSGAFSLRLHYL
jgi:hypothetical protein